MERDSTAMTAAVAASSAGFRTPRSIGSSSVGVGAEEEEDQASDFTSVSQRPPNDGPNVLPASCGGDGSDGASPDGYDFPVVETEPKVKYERLSQDLNGLLRDDATSTLAVHSRVMILGTKFGRTHVLDALGNSLSGSSGFPGSKAFAVVDHKRPVKQISIDHDGEFVAACSEDGKISIRGLMTDSLNHVVNASSKLNTISIDPLYKEFGKRFMTGSDDNVTLWEKSFFNSYNKHVLSEKEGRISLIKWRGRFAAWSCRNKGVKVYDVQNKEIISLVKAPTGWSDREDVPTRIAWSDQFSLFVAFGDVVKTCVIKRRRGAAAGRATGSASNSGVSVVSSASTRHERGNMIGEATLPEFAVEIVSSFMVADSWISGLAPFDDLIVLLAVPKKKEPANFGSLESSHEGRDDTIYKPHLVIAEPKKDGYIEHTSDVLNFRGYQLYSPKDFQMEFLPQDKHYILISPKDIVIAKPRDADDRLDWLLSRERFEEALCYAEMQEKCLSRHTVLSVGKRFLDSLLEENQYKKVGDTCIRLFGTSKKLWEDQILKFARLNQLRSVAPFLPRGEGVHSVRLDPMVYELTLLEFLRTDYEGFLATLQMWDPALYNLSSISKVMLEKLELHTENPILMKAMAIMFGYQRKFRKSMAVYVKLKDKDLFDLIEDNDLYELIQVDAEILSTLLMLDEDRALKLFAENADRIHIQDVLSLLDNRDLLRFSYLDRVCKHHWELSRPHHGKLVAYFINYDPDRLMAFLERSDNYPVANALAMVTERPELIQERIYILARMGNALDALRLITLELMDIQKAIDFCQEQGDDTLWKELVGLSLDKPLFIHELLENIGSHVNPRVLIDKMDMNQEIPGLPLALVKILRDYNLQVTIQEACLRILHSDTGVLLERAFAQRVRAIAIHEETACAACERPLVTVNIGPDSRSSCNPCRGYSSTLEGARPRHATQDEIVALRCRHSFHKKCLSVPGGPQCPICTKRTTVDMDDRRTPPSRSRSPRR